jgi:hypothetical protein
MRLQLVDFTGAGARNRYSQHEKYATLYSRSDFAHQYRPLSIDELRDLLVHRHDDLANLPDHEGVTGPTVLAAMLQITGGNLRLVIRLLAQIERVLDINGLDTVTVEIVAAEREVLVIGGRPLFSLIFGCTVCTAAASSGHAMIWFMSARNCARRVVFPYFSKPVSVCCFIAVLARSSALASDTAGKSEFP